MNRSLRFTTLGALMCLCLAGCAGRMADHDALYARLKERSEALRRGILAGRTIVIDPGHGGTFDGAVGIDSLREADANLGVALYLWGLCADAGARAHLTRTADRDFLSSDSGETAEDLAARVAKANELEPEAFLSIHHNANYPVNRDVNKIEVYYRPGDPGSSLELAQDIQVHLARNLGIETSEVKPGNYYVLRRSTARAAILGEASYLSHPVVEDRLKLAEKQRLEAEAYFLGLIEYFSRGVPTMTRLSPESDTITAPAEIAFSVAAEAGVPLDPVSARIRFGDRDLVPTLEAAASIIRCPMPPDLPNGKYRLTASIRSSRGATAWSETDAILLNRPPRHIIPLPISEKPGGVAALAVKVLDELGLPVADGTFVSARSGKTGETYAGTCRGGTCIFEIPLGIARETFSISADGATAEITAPELEERTTLSMLVIDALTGRAVPFPVVGGSAPASALGDDAGRVLLPISSRPETLIVSAAGYAPSLIEAFPGEAPRDVAAVKLRPLFGGILAGKRIAVDPGGGGSDPEGRGRNSLRGASVNLGVARLLRDLLERAGASVTLTRTGDETVSAQERVYLINRFDADIAIGIRHGAPPSGIDAPRCALFFPGSARGRALADQLAGTLGPLVADHPFAVEAWVNVFLQQTACAACEIHNGPLEEVGREAAMSEPSLLRLEAESILLAISRHFGHAGAGVGDFTVRLTSRGAPEAGASVDIDGISVRETDASGSASFILFEAGAHLLTIRTADGRTKLLVKNMLPNESTLAVDIP